jgi:predicted RNA binding protein YcfA (HicA-like mRNA interferase family)
MRMINAHLMAVVVERNSRKIIQRLESEGWKQVSVSGSHYKFRKGENIIIVPHPKKDLKQGLARAIARQAGWLAKTTDEKAASDTEQKSATDKEQKQ